MATWLSKEIRDCVDSDEELILETSALQNFFMEISIKPIYRVVSLVNAATQIL